MRRVALVSFLLLCAVRAAVGASTDALPAPVPDDVWRPLAACSDPVLQSRLEQEIARRPRWLALTRAGKLGVGLVDLTRIERPRFAQVNGDTMLAAASLAKIAILLAAEDALAAGTLRDSRELQRDLTAMIRVSSNEAATRVIDRLGAGRAGLDRIAALLTAPEYAFFDPQRGGGLWVGSRYPATGDSIPDPLHGLLHAATATQVCRFYHLLATGRLIDREHSAAMLATLEDPGRVTKFVSVLKRTSPRATLYRKSGTWGRHHADSVLVWGDAAQHYIAVALVEDADGDRLLQELLPALEAALHE